ncbi:hypothetical protein GQ55_1G155400 [Panicum hallii var. hallii]|uniref:Uncharacterized protein n=1 Tax=Panicum hallii var. hallii TaxID=1504633 RepID=A0A2T7F5J1_9POAL|nr:hypothetical protein GQ55_1G155400 [Panicum hallii var. hallii]
MKKRRKKKKKKNRGGRKKRGGGGMNPQYLHLRSTNEPHGSARHGEDDIDERILTTTMQTSHGGCSAGDCLSRWR